MDPDLGSDPGSGSCHFRQWLSRCQQKTNFLTQFFLLITFWSRNQGFSYYFCMMIEGSGSNSYLWLVDPDLDGPETCGSGGFGSRSGSATLNHQWGRKLEGWAKTAAGLAGWRRVTQQGVILYVMDGQCRLPLRTTPLAPVWGCLLLNVHKTPSWAVRHARKTGLVL